LLALQRARYAGASSQGIGSQLEKAFKRGLAWRTGVATAKTSSPLPALYPD
jgi:hypothetical protein